MISFRVAFPFHSYALNSIWFLFKAVNIQHLHFPRRIFLTLSQLFVLCIGHEDSNAMHSIFEYVSFYYYASKYHQLFIPKIDLYRNLYILLSIILWYKVLNVPQQFNIFLFLKSALNAMTHILIGIRSNSVFYQFIFCF